MTFDVGVKRVLELHNIAFEKEDLRAFLRQLRTVAKKSYSELTYELGVDQIKMQQEERRKKLVDIIKKEVADEFSITKWLLFADSREMRVVRPRQMFQFILVEYGFRMTEIAEMFKQNHTTPHNSKKVMEALLAQGKFVKQYENIQKRLLKSGVILDCEI